jgi:hypothetical protein
MPAIASLLIGAALALRFRFLVLIPATVLTLIVTLLYLISMGYSPWPIFLSLVASVTALQAGYLCGSVLTPFLRRRQGDVRDRGVPTKTE